MIAVVHLSHHTCDRTAGVDGGSPSGQRRPVLLGCRAVRDRGAVRVSARTADVTCRHCLRDIRRDADAYAARADAPAPDRAFWDGWWVDDAELVERAWLHCCRHRGAPCPMSAERLAEHERRRDLELVGALDQLAYRACLEPAAALADLEAQLAGLTDIARARVRPLVDEVNRAARLGAEALAARARARTVARDLRATLSSLRPMSGPMLAVVRP